MDIFLRRQVFTIHV